MVRHATAAAAAAAAALARLPVMLKRHTWALDKAAVLLQQGLLPQQGPQAKILI